MTIFYGEFDPVARYGDETVLGRDFGKIANELGKKRLFTLIIILAVWLGSSFFCNPLVVPVILINAYILWGPLAFVAVKLGFIKPGPEYSAGPAEQENSKS